MVLYKFFADGFVGAFDYAVLHRPRSRFFLSYNGSYGLVFRLHNMCGSDMQQSKLFKWVWLIHNDESFMCKKFYLQNDSTRGRSYLFDITSNISAMLFFCFNFILYINPDSSSAFIMFILAFGIGTMTSVSNENICIFNFL